MRRRRQGAATPLRTPASSPRPSPSPPPLQPPAPASASASDPERDAAFAEASRVFGTGAVAGRNLHDGTVYVGKRWQGDWIVKGVGATWRAALSDALAKDAPVK